MPGLSQHGTPGGAVRVRKMHSNMLAAMLTRMLAINSRFSTATSTASRGSENHGTPSSTFNSGVLGLTEFIDCGTAVSQAGTGKSSVPTVVAFVACEVTQAKRGLIRALYNKLGDASRPPPTKASILSWGSLAQPQVDDVGKPAPGGRQGLPRGQNWQEQRWGYNRMTGALKITNFGGGGFLIMVIVCIIYPKALF